MMRATGVIEITPMKLQVNIISNICGCINNEIGFQRIIFPEILLKYNEAYSIKQDFGLIN